MILNVSEREVRALSELLQQCDNSGIYEHLKEKLLRLQMAFKPGKSIDCKQLPNSGEIK